MTDLPLGLDTAQARSAVPTTRDWGPRCGATTTTSTSPGYAMAGDQAGSLRCLQRARRIAPQQTRHRPMVRETVLAVAAARRGREELSLIATWLSLN